MEICDNILDSIENKNSKRNDAIYHIVYDEFCKRLGTSFTFADESATYGNKVRALKEQYVYTSGHVSLFFDILKENGYYMREEIKDAMHELGLLKDPNANSEIIKRYLNSPVIQDISFDGTSKFTIDSERYGRLVFELASYLYRDNQKVKEYIETKKLPNECHNHAYFMSQVFSDYYSITSLCKAYFRGKYFHSYSYDKERNIIIDLCSNAVVSKDAYYSLFKPRDVSVILNSDIDEEYRKVIFDTYQPFNRCELLKIALYKLYLESINYTGDYFDGPRSYSLRK